MGKQASQKRLDKAHQFMTAKHEQLRRYRKLREKAALDAFVVLLEQQNGSTANGNINYIARELCSNPGYQSLEVYFSVADEKRTEIESELAAQGIRVKLVERNSDDYYRLLATAKYLVCDNSFPPEFVKRPDQVLVNTWHGTPLKTLGKQIPGQVHLIGNVEKGFLTSTYLLAPNEHTVQVFQRDYMLQEFGAGNLLLCGYPRNAVLCREPDAALRESLIGPCMHAYAYLPTFRTTQIDGTKGGANDEVAAFLQEADGLLQDDERLYVHLHPSVSADTDFSEFQRVLPFPAGVETYEFLALCDGLVTDYSSVFFDFALTRRKIVLYTYDEEQYLASRGTYFPLDELPFPRVANTGDVLAQLRSPIQYEDAAFLAKYCPYDNADATAAFCRHVFLGVKHLEERLFRAREARRALVYIGRKGCGKNSVAAGIQAVQERLSDCKVLYLIAWQTIKDHRWILNALPEGSQFLPTSSQPIYSMNELAAKALPDSPITAGVKKRASRSFLEFEKKRLLGDMEFDAIYHIMNGELRDGLPMWM